MKPNNRRKLKTGPEAFSSCPACDSPHLIAFEDEVICNYCGWDSIAVRVEARFARMKSTSSVAEMIEQAAQIESIFPLYDSTESSNEREEYSSREARRLLQEDASLLDDLPSHYDVA